MCHNTNKKYGVPKEEISCPGCGQVYGHHNTKVDINSQECSKCAENSEYPDIELMEADKYITEVLGYKPFYT